MTKHSGEYQLDLLWWSFCDIYKCIQNIQSLCCTPGTNIIIHVNFTSTKNEVKDLERGRLDYSGLFRSAQNIHRNLYKDKKRAEKLVRRRFGNAMLLDLKMEEGALSQRMQGASRS